MTPQEIDIREEPIREIISRPPSWLVRWGVTIMAAVVGLVLLISFLLKYPDTLEGRVRITTTDLPMSIKARSSGYLSELRVKDGDFVEKGEVLGILENTANVPALLSFKEKWEAFHQKLMQSDSVPALRIQQQVDFGQVQSAYIQLWGAYQLYQNFLQRGSHRERLRQQQQQLNSIRQVREELKSQELLLKQTLGIARDKYATDQKLYSTGAISKREFQQSEQALKERELSWERWKASQLQEQIREEELLGQKADIRLQFQRERQEYLSTLRQASLSFSSALSDWEQQYLLRASISGEVALFQIWSERQWVEAGKEVMVISPKSKQLFGQLLLDQAGMGKLKTGQQVYIKLDGYPYEQFGQVKGQVSDISSIAREGQYAVKVALPQGLHTTYKEQLPFHQEMEGQASVITEDLRLIERFFYQARKLLASR